jgi:hypothetical protein
MLFNPHLPPAFDFILQVDRLFSALIPPADPEHGLGGNLLYAGELDAPGRALVVAGNIAGAASLAATADPAAQKQAIHEGVIDFLVTSLEEALRILKNEIRKRETVAVCVAASPLAVEREMLERGVLPDLLPPGAAGAPEFAAFLSQGARLAGPADAASDQIRVAWSVASAPALWLPKLDAVAHDCLAPEDWPARRWLRLAPRYLGRQAQGIRLLRCNDDAARRFLDQVRQRTERSEIAVPVEIQVLHNEDCSLHLPEQNLAE